MVITKAGTAYGSDINPEQLREEVKNLIKRIKLNDIALFNQAEKISYKTVKALYDDYYKCSRWIIEDGNFTADEELPFDEMKPMVDVAYKYVLMMDTIERNIGRGSLSKFEWQVTENKCNEIKLIADKYPIITDHVENVINQFYEKKISAANQMKTIETILSRDGASQKDQAGNTLDSTPSDKTPTLIPKPSTSSNDNQQQTTTICYHQKQSTSTSESDTQKPSTSSDHHQQPTSNSDHNRQTDYGDTNTNEVPVNGYGHPYYGQYYWWDYNQYQTNWSGGAKVAAKKLEKFNGDPLAYHTFRKTIQHYVVDNPQIRGNANKIMEIIDLLPHKDRYIIECFNPDTCTMASIMAELDEHYASPNRIIPALVDRLRKAPFLSLRPSERDWEALVEVAILIRNTLSSANLASEERSLQILQYFKTGLDRERTATSQIASSDLNVKSTNRPNMQAYRPTKNVMFATATTTCMFADGNHKTENCPLTIQERRKIAIEKRMCFRCGGFRHNSKDCNRRLKCAICSRNHTTYMCNDLKPKASSATTTSNEVKTNTNGNINQTIPKQMAETSTSNGSQSSKQSVTNNLLTQNSTSLYKTTMATINGRKVRVLFDDGSGSSFISRRLAELWRLKTDDVEPIYMETLSQSSPTVTGSKVVSLSIPIWNGTNERLKFRINDKLNKLRFDCVSHDQQLMIRQHDILFHDEPKMVDILIGLDNINKIQLEDEKRLSNDVVAKRTTLGWIVFGLSKSSNVLLTLYQNIGHETAPEYDVDEESKLAMEKFVTNYCQSDNVKYDESNKRYSIKLPFIANIEVDSNFIEAKKMIAGMVKRMNGDRRRQYQSLMDEMVKNDVIEQTAIATEIGYHMPHFVIARDDKNTTKLRMVFNASHGKQPLNKAIFKGVTSWSIVRSLLNFRMKPVGVISDIQSAFHNIEIDTEHRDYVKFLWVNLDDELMCYRFNRLPFGLSSSPFALYAVIVHHLQKFEDKFPRTVNIVRQGLYVDDLIFSATDTIEAEMIKEQCVQIFDEASMKLRKWRSSHHELNQLWNDNLAESKVLGMEWTDDDCLRVMIPDWDDNNALTKRYLVSYIASIYDPFGLVLATCLRLKLLIHEAWVEGHDWDDVLPDEFQRKVMKIVNDIRLLKTFSCPRFIFDRIVNEFELIVFVDASKDAIGVAAYLSDGKTMSLIYAKSKLIKHRKIVTGELMALSYGANIAKSLDEMIRPKHLVLYSDSMDNVQRLERDINQFPYPVAVHLYNIKSKVADIRHIRGEKNPADAYTRGIKSDQLNGIHRIKCNDILETDAMNVMMVIDDKTEMKYDLTDIDLDKECSYDEWIQQIDEKSDDWKRKIDDGLDNLRILIKLNQQVFIGQQLRDRFPMFKDEHGLWRCHSRLENADLPYEEKFPIVLPKCEFTRSLLICLHEKDEHASVNYTLANLRTRYFLVKARQQMIRIKAKCVKCRQLKTKPLIVNMGNLPPERINRCQPFENIGVDLFELKTEPKSIGIIFTCCVTRCVHFELLDDATAKEICRAFLIFSDLNRTPTTIISDNGANLKRLSRMLCEAMRLLKNEFHWHFNVPAAPFRGGFFESLIKTMKRAFYSIIWQQSASRNDVRAILYRIQAIMNSRPLVNDGENILTPNHLRFGENVRGPIAPPRTGGNSDELLTYWRRKQTMINAAWKTYRNVYMKDLRKFYQNGNEHHQVEVGDPVLIVDDHKPTALWTTGVVMERIPDKRGIVRTYKIKLGDKILVRPAQRIAPLEVAENGGGMLRKDESLGGDLDYQKKNCD
ncbi:hypothetical protein DERF_013441 [Dermatophagoides farinae]|uniref:Uncharacterized protein n=1 Tax=Dermatophagoides farinae TaxID=6954 RepID=A0A922HPP5_DERFA|nr:hypothetical protein DERF_013441 [Dermatophagoides farinae]